MPLITGKVSKAFKLGDGNTVRMKFPLLLTNM